MSSLLPLLLLPPCLWSWWWTPASNSGGGSNGGGWRAVASSSPLEFQTYGKWTGTPLLVSALDGLVMTSPSAFPKHYYLSIQLFCKSFTSISLFRRNVSCHALILAPYPLMTSYQNGGSEWGVGRWVISLHPLPPCKMIRKQLILTETESEHHKVLRPDFEVGALRIGPHL